MSIQIYHLCNISSFIQYPLHILHFTAEYPSPIQQPTSLHNTFITPLNILHLQQPHKCPQHIHHSTKYPSPTAAPQVSITHSSLHWISFTNSSASSLHNTFSITHSSLHWISFTNSSSSFHANSCATVHEHPLKEYSISCCSHRLQEQYENTQPSRQKNISKPRTKLMKCRLRATMFPKNCWLKKVGESTRIRPADVSFHCP